MAGDSENSVATKADLAELKAELKADVTGLIESLRTEAIGRIESGKVETFERIERSEITLLKEFRKWSVRNDALLKLHGARDVSYDQRISLLEERVAELEEHR